MGWGGEGLWVAEWVLPSRRCLAPTDPQERGTPARRPPAASDPTALPEGLGEVWPQISGGLAPDFGSYLAPTGPALGGGW